MPLCPGYLYFRKKVLFGSIGYLVSKRVFSTTLNVLTLVNESCMYVYFPSGK